MYVKVYKNWPCTYLRTSSPGGTGVAGSSQESLRHMRKSAYRCFLPDLTGFTGSHCAGPNLQRYPRQPDPKEERPRISFNPAVADCGLQGTAISPSSTAKLQTQSKFQKTLIWRREWDLNPRDAYASTRSPGVLLQPLGHPSTYT